jgi:hypothetical protein
MARNITSGLVGAVLGASALIWGGNAARDWSAHAQTSSRDVLITALYELATAIAPSPGNAANTGKAQAVRAGAVRVAAGGATRTEITGLISQSFVPGNAALSAAMARADQALKASNLP